MSNRVQAVATDWCVLSAPRGDGHLFRPQYTDRHGDRKKASVWWWRVSIAGVKQKAVSTGCSDEKAAKAWVRKRLGEMEAGDFSSLTADSLTLDKLEKIVADDYAVNARRTKRHIPLSFSRLARLLGNTKAKDLTTARLKWYAARRLEEGAANATINLDFALLGKAMNLAARDGILPRRPKGWIPFLRLDNARKGFLERPAFDAILSHVPAVLRGVLVTAYITGWRLHSDLLTRQWRHVDLDAGWLRLEPGEGKTGEGRMFPVTGELREVLEGQRAYTDECEAEGRIIPWVFHRRGKRIVSIQKAWEAARRKAGIPGALVHDFRRTAVRNLERAGVPRSAAMRLVGHQTEAIYRRYAIVDESMLKEGADKLSALLEKQKDEAAKVTALRKR